MKQRCLAAGLVLVWGALLFFSACARLPSSEVRPQEQRPFEIKTATEEIGLPSWNKEWNKALLNARKEGALSIYSSASGEVLRALAKAFQNSFGIPLEFISGKGGDVAVKLIREHKAGLYLADVYIGGSTPVITQIKPAGLLEKLEPVLILPEVKDPVAWWGGEMLWIDQERKHLAFTIYAIQALTINNTLVKSEEIKSYRDLLEPRWKGKFIMFDPSIAGIAGKWFSMVGRYIMDLDYMRALAKQEPVILRDARLLADWLAKGKYSIGIAAVTDMVTEFKASGAPLSYIEPVEGTWLGNGSGGLSLVSKAPHPNAATVFINWLLTPEAQSIFSQTYGAPSARRDVPVAPTIDPITSPRPGAKYVIGFKEEMLVIADEDYVRAREIFGHLMGR